MNRKVLYAFRCFFAVLCISICVFIFINSADTAADSGEKSRTIVEIFQPSVLKKHKGASEAEKTKAVDTLANMIRKSAHGMEYALLGFSAVGFALTFAYEKKDGEKRHWLLFLCGWTFAVLNAAGDEIRQKFSSGRSCEIKDIFLDGLSALLGALICFGIAAALENLQKRKNCV